MKARDAVSEDGLDRGLVVASHGRHSVVEAPDGQRLICHPRGKKNQAVVGDRVLWRAQPAGQGDEGTVERVEPRRNLFYREDELRIKSFAANLDQVLVLLAAEPEFSESQLARALIAAAAAGITPLLALNKSDLVEPFERAWARLAPYRQMGYGVLPLSLRLSADVDREHLMEHLRGKTTLVLGPSGTGKSTLVNLMVPGADVQTGTLSEALRSGRHTTTSTRWYWLDGSSGPAIDWELRTALIDSPGFQEFGLHHIEPTALAQLMPDLQRETGACRFYNCSHLHEPGCGVLAAAERPESAGGISPSRYRIYRELHAELGSRRY